MNQYQYKKMQKHNIAEVRKREADEAIDSHIQNKKPKKQ